MFCRKKGQYFEVDALIALTLLISGLIYVRNIDIQKIPMKFHSQYSQQIINLLTTVKVADLDKEYINLILSSNLTDYINDNNSIAKQAIIFMMKGNKSLAMNITSGLINPFIPQNFQYALWLKYNGIELIYNSSEIDYESDISVSKTLITGIEEDNNEIDILAQKKVPIIIEAWVFDS